MGWKRYLTINKSGEFIDQDSIKRAYPEIPPKENHKSNIVLNDGETLTSDRDVKDIALALSNGGNKFN